MDRLIELLLGVMALSAAVAALVADVFGLGAFGREPDLVQLGSTLGLIAFARFSFARAAGAGA